MAKLQNCSRGLLLLRQLVVYVCVCIFTSGVKLWSIVAVRKKWIFSH